LLFAEINDPLAKIKKFIIKFPWSRLLILSATSNDLFIETRLQSMRPSIHSDIIAHHAIVSKSRHHIFFDPIRNPDKDCPLCQGSFCKGAALVNYLDLYAESDKPFERVHFICDGTSDLCAALRLSENDIVYIRTGETLDGILREGKFRGFNVTLRAQTVRWATGVDLKEEMEEFII
jgi:hypothetical protein